MKKKFSELITRLKNSPVLVRTLFLIKNKFFLPIFSLTGILIYLVGAVFFNSNFKNENTPFKNISSIIWRFERLDGTVITNKVLLDKNYKLKYFKGINEESWGKSNNSIIFYNASKLKTTIFDKFEKINGKWALSGDFLLDKSIRHRLVEVGRIKNNMVVILYICLVLFIISLFRFNFAKNRKLRNTLLTGIILLVAIFSFVYSVSLRTSWFGKLSLDHHQWLSGATIKFTNMWLDENPFKLLFGMIENPKSIEFSSLKDRGIYSSYPSGIIFPLYVLGLFNGGKLTPDILMGYNLANHFLISIIMSLTIFIFFKKLKAGDLAALLFSLLPIFLYLFLPPPMYWHQNVFFTDQAIILYFVGIIFLEVLSDTQDPKLRKIIFILQAVIIFIGVSIDWFFYIITFVLYVKKILNFEYSKKGFLNFILRSFFFWLPVALSLGIFLIQQIALGGLKALYDKFLFRTAMDGNTYVTNFFNQFWKGHIKYGYGEIGFYLIWISSLFLLLSFVLVVLLKINKKKIDSSFKSVISLYSLYLVPCFIQIYFLKNHSVIHDFSALKFAVVLSTVPFILFPILLFKIIKMFLDSYALNVSRNKNISRTTLSRYCGKCNRNYTNNVIYPLSFSNRLLKRYSNKEFLNFNRISNSAILIFFIFIYFCSIFYINDVIGKIYIFFPNSVYKYEREIFINKNTKFNDIVFSPNFSIDINPPQHISFSKKRVYMASNESQILNIINSYKKVKKDNIVINLFINIRDNKNQFSSIIANADNKIDFNDYTLYKISYNSLKRLLKK
ncbi:MAG TPA: hypothetical protein PK385_08420 [Spirochaetota bacterium]|nr:hypothetical protein [Spirochaetota bacterium]HOS31667.1 hypothetical protein [Spirochaetota bacterium]HOS56068.1 hypothetical protein [Spirochaetota bacterium]HPK61218.1 hypothetical protein [Spirochaetota bacterium]HQF77223.1 hypothetical protein [Spirochaetota bacterium]